jgi:hypothetical protein
VHLLHELHHLVERLAGRLDDDVHTVTEHLEVEVGHERCDLDEGIGLQVEARHLAVDPDKSLRHEDGAYS